MNTFVTHPSVRIKGTENNYEPMQCLDPACPSNKNMPLHMHCPFCVRTEAFHDAVILRAHYRVKHVDKGIEFAGLKVLRCCDHCDIVGTIKGVKEFKGAHWHCYKCKNGFNRRDEAIKHYRTHFRNPQTTFQIQVAHEVNQNLLMGHAAETTTETIHSDLTSIGIHPALTEAVMTTSTAESALISSTSTDMAMTNGRPSSDNELTVSVAANETVNTSDGQTLMIIHEEQVIQGAVAGAMVNNNTIQVSADMQQADVTEGIDMSTLLEERALLQSKVEQLTAQNQALQQEAKLNQQARQDLTDELQSLKVALQVQMSSAQRREQELLNQLSVPLDAGITELLQQLKSAHEDLLHQQLAQLRRSYIQAATAVSSVDAGEQPLLILASAETAGDGTTTLNPTMYTAEELKPDPSGQLVVVTSGTDAQPNSVEQQESELITEQTDDITTTTVAENDVTDSGVHDSDAIYRDNVVEADDGTESTSIHIENGVVLDATENSEIVNEDIDIGEHVIAQEETQSHECTLDTTTKTEDEEQEHSVVIDMDATGDHITSSPRAKRKRTN